MSRTIKPITPTEAHKRDVQVNLVAEKILDGVCRRDLDHFCMKELKLSKTQTATLIKDASKKIDSLFSERFEGKLPSIAAGFQTIYDRAMRDNDYKAANEALKNLSMLMGLMKTKVENKNEVIINGELKDVPTEELIRLATEGK